MSQFGGNKFDKPSPFPGTLGRPTAWALVHQTGVNFHQAGAGADLFIRRLAWHEMGIGSNYSFLGGDGSNPNAIPW